MKQKLRLFDIHQTTTSLRRTHNLNPRTKWYPGLDESNRMKSTYFIIQPAKNPPPQNGCRLKSRFFFFKSTGFTSSTFPIQPNSPQNQPVAITLNTGFSPDIGVWPPLHTQRNSEDGWIWWRKWMKTMSGMDEAGGGEGKKEVQSGMGRAQLFKTGGLCRRSVPNYSPPSINVTPISVNPL